MFASPASAADAPVLAADDAAAEGQQLDEIVVTAQKRRENLQETPISISVLSGEAIQNRHIVSLVDLGDGSVPGLSDNYDLDMRFLPVGDPKRWTQAQVRQAMADAYLKDKMGLSHADLMRLRDLYLTRGAVVPGQRRSQA